MTRAQAWLFIASGLAGLFAVSIASGKEHWPKRALMKGAVGVCVAQAQSRWLRVQESRRDE
ncbi:MAG: hypothetical protein WBM01_15115 [Mycobacterium sp.]|uniref:hypothetical protein n=1 Tax=Mycobacterium sp. TaxID=1785 RepID=UPI003C759F4A